jgi:hypothetical protein
MATITDAQCTAVRQQLHEFHLDLLKGENPYLTKSQVKAALQAIEDWYDGQRLSVKADIDTAVGQTVGNNLAKKLGKFWMKIKWGLE